MSYPVTIQPLVIEDHEQTKDVYDDIFATIRSESDAPFRPADPCFAFSFEEAIQFLEGSKIFHVVVLDLRLPVT